MITILHVPSHQAGIPAGYICIVTEEQAAATFCRSMLKVGGEKIGEARVIAGQKYLILDVGGKQLFFFD